PATGECHAYHLRRAHYLGLIGEEEEQRREKARAEAAPPTSTLDYFLTGVHLYQQAELDRAARMFDMALGQRQDHFWSQFFLAATRLRQRNWQAADFSFSLCLGRHPGVPWALLLRGFARVELARFDAAEADFRQAQAAQERNRPPSTAPGRPFERKFSAALSVYRGILCFQQRQLPEAADHYLSAVREQPTLYQA